MRRAPHRTLHRVLAGLTAAAAAWTLASCNPDDLQDDAPEGPVNDADLLALIQEIDHVSQASVEYVPYTFENGDYYDAFVTVDDEVQSEADAFCVMDQVYAILWMGRSTLIEVEVLRGPDPQDEHFSQRDLGPDDGWWSEAALAERYGPRPEPGSDPTPAPAPACG
ncbi:hypothetical protein [Sanguibacter sp. 25GB23B1]|uniref:hypothetical protein n=1 Tax=unclassified Sanguibacter TaxID=2645534 RepID=UPI0032AF74FB